MHILQLALPKYEAPPTFRAQSTEVLSVALGISKTFSAPVFDVTSWRATPLRTRMLMPEASVNEYHLLSSSKNEIWDARQFFVVETVAEA